MTGHTYTFDPDGVVEGVDCINGVIQVGAGATSYGHTTRHDTIAVAHTHDAGQSRILLTTDQAETLAAALGAATTAIHMGRAS